MSILNADIILRHGIASQFNPANIKKGEAAVLTDTKRFMAGSANGEVFDVSRPAATVTIGFTSDSDYQLTGNAATDTQILQSVFDSLFNGGKVVIREGNIVTNNTINIIKSNVTITGMGDSTVFDSGPSGPIIYFSITGNNCKIQNIKFNGAQYALTFTGSRYNSVSGCTFNNCGTGIATSPAFGGWSIYSENHFISCGVGISLYTPYNLIASNIFDLTQNTPVMIGGTVQYNQLTGNNFDKMFDTVNHTNIFTGNKLGEGKFEEYVLNQNNNTFTADPRFTNKIYNPQQSVNIYMPAISTGFERFVDFEIYMGTTAQSVNISGGIIVWMNGILNTSKPMTTYLVSLRTSDGGNTWIGVWNAV